MSSLTDRYVYAVVRRLPHESRDDVARELRATIADTIDDRPDGMTPSAAERLAIAELGDPERLASGYSGRPQYLIGPAFYPLYLRMIKILPPVIAFIVAGFVLLGLAIEGEASAGKIVTHVWQAILIALLQVCFWTTLGFAIAERLGADPGLGRPFDPDALAEEPPARQIGFVDSIFAMIFELAVLALLVVDAEFVFGTSEGTEVVLLGPIPAGVRAGLVGLLAGMVVLEAVKLARGRWNYPLAVVNALLEVPFAGLMAWLLLGGLISDATRAAVGDELPWTAIDTALRIGAVGVVLVAAWGIFDGFHKAYQARQAEALRSAPAPA